MTRRLTGPAKGVSRPPSIAALLLAVALLACVSSGGDERVEVVCATGETTICPCDGGFGTRTCNQLTRWDACSCDNATRPDAGPCLCSSGCCAIGACRVGVTEEVCGGDGLACVRCGPGELCVNQGCVMPTTGGLTLRVVSATAPSFDPAKRSCLTWDCFDPGGVAPDLFVRERGRRFRTTVAWNLYTPTWNEAVATGLTPSQLAEPIEVDLVDDDSVESSAFDGIPVENVVAHFEIRLRPEQRVPGQLVFTSGASAASLVTLTLELR